MEHTEGSSWQPFSWYCSNCGKKVTAYKNKRGSMKVECTRCKTVMVRTNRSRRHTTIEYYAPDGKELSTTAGI